MYSVNGTNHENEDEFDKPLCMGKTRFTFGSRTSCCNQLLHHGKQD